MVSELYRVNDNGEKSIRNNDFVRSLNNSGYLNYNNYGNYMWSDKSYRVSYYITNKKFNALLTFDTGTRNIEMFGESRAILTKIKRSIERKTGFKIRSTFSGLYDI